MIGGMMTKIGVSVSLIVVLLNFYIGALDVTMDHYRDFFSDLDSENMSKIKEDNKRATGFLDKFDSVSNRIINLVGSGNYTEKDVKKVKDLSEEVRDYEASS